MKTTYKCAKCGIAQIERALDELQISWEEKRELMTEAMRIQARIFDDVPANVGTKVQRFLKKKIGRDIFKEWKKVCLGVAKEKLKEILPELKTLKDFCIAAIMANYIDFTSIKGKSKLLDFKKLRNERLEIDNFDEFEKELKKSKKILYLTDNYGEHLFDSLLIREISKLGKDIIVAAKESPILNDATVLDLKDSGVEKYAKVISLGSDCIGTNLNEVSKEFLKEFNSADLIIAKGMGHYETLDEIKDKRIVFMLRAKCEPVARRIGVRKGSNVLLLKNIIFDDNNKKLNFLNT